jgi:hypothetical protein
VGGVEYLGVGGVWTAQAAITKTVWVWDGWRWNVANEDFSVYENNEYVYNDENQITIER